LPLEGACCLWNGICVLTTVDVCSIEYEGEYQGDGTSCDPNPCPPSPGNDCSDPLVVQLPAELPYQHADATCARVDDYTDTCLFPYDEGEDFICRLDVSETVFVDITLDPVGTPGTGIALSDVCPPSTTCIAFSIDDKGWLHGIYGQTLEPGTYYLMVDTAKWAGCAGFGLQIEYPNP
ncbi:MAG: hypothetical protein KKI02_08815, partial [Planctomycetes bacterium]|nr:hypothetical protein [Planctomycetota bacterium]